MRPDNRFLNQPKSFWANIRLISQEVGYTDRKTKMIRIPTRDEAVHALKNIGLAAQHLVTEDGQETTLGRDVFSYFEYRAEQLDNHVEPRLMDKDRAEEVFTEHRERLDPDVPLPMNKQKGEKKTFAFFTGLINMLLNESLGGRECDYNPRQLTTVSLNDVPLRTLARWVDGAFPSTVNPVAVWEIKEYYNTTTFGSRVADGVYESLLDGMELEELREHENIDVRHYFMVDSHYTWWESGKSYLCRMVDMLNMGYVDEVLFGYEVVEEIPRIAKEWVEALER